MSVRRRSAFFRKALGALTFRGIATIGVRKVRLPNTSWGEYRSTFRSRRNICHPSRKRGKSQTVRKCNPRPPAWLRIYAPPDAANYVIYSISVPYTGASGSFADFARSLRDVDSARGRFLFSMMRRCIARINGRRGKRAAAPRRRNARISYGDVQCGDREARRNMRIKYGDVQFAGRGAPPLRGGATSTACAGAANL